MVKAEVPAVKLNIYLMKESCTKHVEALRYKHQTKQGHSVAVSDDVTGLLFVTKSIRDRPPWSDFFASRIAEKDTIFGGTSSASAVFVLQVNGRYFTLTFAQARERGGASAGVRPCLLLYE